MKNCITVNGVEYELTDNHDDVRDCRNCGIKELCCCCFATCLAVALGRESLEDKRYFHFKKKEDDENRFVELIYKWMDEGEIDVRNIEKLIKEIKNE